MAWILRRLPGAGLLREAWHATQLQGAIHEKKRAERALVLAEQNAQIGEFYIDICTLCITYYENFLKQLTQTTMAT